MTQLVINPILDETWEQYSAGLFLTLDEHDRRPHCGVLSPLLYPGLRSILLSSSESAVSPLEHLASKAVCHKRSPPDLLQVV